MFAKTVIKIGANKKVRDMIYEVCDIVGLEYPEEQNGVLVLNVNVNMMEMGIAMLKKIPKKDFKNLHPMFTAIGFTVKKK